MTEERRPFLGRSMGIIRESKTSQRAAARAYEEEALEAEQYSDPYRILSREQLRRRAEREKESARRPKAWREQLELGRTGAKQTVIVKKSVAKTRSAAAKVAKKHADRIYTSRETKDVWRFRQRPPGCFQEGSMRTWCKPGNGVCIVYGTLKKGAEKRKACK